MIKHTNGDRLQQDYEERTRSYGEMPWLDRNGPQLIVLCIVALVAIAGADYLWSWVMDVALDRIELEI